MQTIPNRPSHILQIAATLFPLVAFAASAQATDRVYTLVPDTPFDGSPFGFSGSITTDGSIGYFSDVSFIKDWSITVHTPAAVDGIATEVFTRASGPPLQAHASTGSLICDCIHVTESTISIDAPSPPVTNRVLAIGVAGGSPTSIAWIGPYFTLTGRPREVQIVDVSESPQLESRMFGDLSSLPVAAGGIAIPEPATVVLILTALAAVFASRPSHPRPTRATQVAASALLIILGPFSAVQADIFQWEYINPADPSQGKQQSTTLAPDGAGVDAVPGTYLGGRNLTMAYLIGADVGSASFFGATLTDADFTGAEVRGANFSLCSLRGCRRGSGINLTQLYSTASYQAHDLSGISLALNDLTGGNVAGQNLTDANFGDATLSDADFTGAEVRGANFGHTTWNGFTAAQLYSTASYQVHDLTAIGLAENNLNFSNFAGQNLTNATFSYSTVGATDFREANLTNASFYYATLRHANITNAYFFGVTLTGADVSSADARGAQYLSVPAGAIITNLILPDGHISGLDLAPSGLLIVRDYDGDFRCNPELPPISITVDQQMMIGPGGTLRMVFAANDWGSTFSFAPGIPVTLGGTLELIFAEDVNLASQVGRTFDLFDWTGINPTGTFAISSPYVWNLSNLYTTGEVTLTAVPEPTTLAMLLIGALVILAPQYAGIAMPNKRKEKQLP